MGGFQGLEGRLSIPGLTWEGYQNFSQIPNETWISSCADLVILRTWFAYYALLILVDFAQVAVGVMGSYKMQE
jgi:hypothetical protein